MKTISLLKTITLTAMSFALLPNLLYAAKCEYNVASEWGSGFTASIRITNTGTSEISDWSLGWNYTGSTRITSSWNVNLAGNNPYTATPLSWNKKIPAGTSVEFGIQGSKPSGSAQIPLLTGAVCNNTAASSRPASSRPASSRPASSRASSRAASSRPASSRPASSRPASSRPISSVVSNSSSGATCNGYATRYWDCCKAHCSWKPNVPDVVNPLPSCSSNNSRITDINAGSSCNGGSANMCWGMGPVRVNDNLAYGFAATSSGDVCGRCYQLEFTGQSYNAPGDPGSAALAGKTMIVQATNIGYDVSGGQFDILVPGGGVGAFNACSAQWGVSNSELGAQYGGFLSACKQELGYNASLSQYKTCVKNRCSSVFGSRGLTELQNACNWYADWFQAADNPALKYKEVACPSELISRSGMNRGPLNDIKTSCN